MLSVDFPGSNHTFGKPADMTDEQCHSVQAYVGVDAEQFPFVMTAWKPSYEDMKALNAGEPLYLKILGNGMPPVFLFTVDEAGNGNF